MTGDEDLRMRAETNQCLRRDEQVDDVGNGASDTLTLIRRIRRHEHRGMAIGAREILEPLRL